MKKRYLGLLTLFALFFIIILSLRQLGIIEYLFPLSLHHGRVSPPYENTWLWKIEKNGQPISYLLGTLHLGKMNNTLPLPIIDAFNKTNSLVTEVNLKPSDLESFELGMQMLDRDTLLSEKLKSSLYQQLTENLNESVPVPALEKMKPWAVLILFMYNKPEGYSEKFSLEMLLTERALKEHKSRYFLESLPESLSYISSLPEERVINYLTVLIQNSEDARKQTNKLIRLYETQQINKISELRSNKIKLFRYFSLEEQEFWYTWLTQDLLTKRNQKWLAQLQDKLPEESLFIAVGALHLIGDDGLIERLQDMGYRLTPILYR